MKINIVAFLTLILLAGNAFGMGKEKIVHLDVNKSGTLLCSASDELSIIRTSILNIWRIVSCGKTYPRRKRLLKMKNKNKNH